MNTTAMLRRILVSLVFFSTCMVAWPQPAQASIDDFISVYQKIEAAAPSGSLPVSTAQIKAYKGLFQCIEGGGDVIVCTNTFQQTDAGQQATSDIPSGVWKVVEAYIAWKAGDVWGVVQHLGEAAMCAVLQVIAGGADICGLIDDLIEAGKALLDAGKAVVEFFKDLGEGAWNAVKGAYCSTPLSVFGGCEDSGPPPKPKAQVIYEKFFAPKVLPDGLTAIESEDLWASDKLLNQLKSQAKAQGYAEADILTASDIFAKAVDGQWTADVVNRVLKNLAAERNSFNTDGSIGMAANYAWDLYKKSKSNPQAKIPLYCNEHFVTLGYSHVTRWVNAHPDKAKELMAQTNYQWCKNVFWEGNKAKFAEYFKKYMEPTCPGLGCTSTADLGFCNQLMKNVGLNCVFVSTLKGPKPVMKAVPPKEVPHR